MRNPVPTRDISVPMPYNTGLKQMISRVEVSVITIEAKRTRKAAQLPEE